MLPHGRLADKLEKEGARPGSGLDLTLLAGTWYATDPAADGVVRLELTVDGGALMVRAFGAGPDQLIDWGEVPATAFGSGVAAHQAMAFSAEFRFEFLSTLLAAYAKQGILVLDTFTTFSDSSGRANYFSREFFHR